MTDNTPPSPGPQPGAAIPEPPRVVLVVIDDTEEMQVALDYASLLVTDRPRARVGLLHVIEPADFEHWFAVSQVMREEARADAEKLVNAYARRVNDLTGKRAVLYMREGHRAEQILRLLEEDKDVVAVVLAAAEGDNPGPLVRHLTSRGLRSLRVPVVIVPGTLDFDALKGLV